MAVQLVSLPEIERLGPACIRILGGNPGKFTLQGTNTYLLGTGPQRLLVDTGEGKPSWIAAVKRTLDEEGASVTGALITHWHYDHVGGVAQLLEISPDTKVYKQQPGHAQLDIADGQTFRVDGASLRAVHAPGHTVDHTVFVWQEEDALFTGDNVLGQGTAVFEDLGVYMASLEKMRHLFQGRAYPAHGPVLPDGPGKIAEYIRHRHMREEQVVQALRLQMADGGDSTYWTAMELVKVIYHDVEESLHQAAEGGVRQVLEKLEREGKISRHDHGWKLRSRSAL